MCHHGHRDHQDGHRHHRDGRRNRRHHRDGPRNHRAHRCQHRNPDDQEHRREPAGRQGDRPWCDRASCPGSGAGHRGGDHQHRREPDGHPAGGAFPGWERRGCCRDGQPTVRRGPHAGHGPHGPPGAFPGWGQRGCCQDEGPRVGARGEGCRRRPHGRPEREPWEREPWEPAPSGREPWLPAPWERAWLPAPWEPVPSGRAPQVARQARACSALARPEQRSGAPRGQEPREPQEPPGPRRRGRVPRGLPGRRAPWASGHRAWLPTSWLQGWCFPWPAWPYRRLQRAARGTTHEPCGPQGVRWSMKPTGRTRPVLSDD